MIMPKITILQRFECVVLSVDAKGVSCQMLDLTDRSKPLEYAEILYEQFDAADRHLLSEGVIFRFDIWQIGETKQPKFRLIKSSLDIIKADFPEFFIDSEGKYSARCGADCPEGWAELLEAFCQKVAAIPDSDFCFSQIKEKFGGLRVYADYAISEITKLIDELEAESLQTCQKCGSKEDIEPTESLWHKTQCKNCNAKKGRLEEYIALFKRAES